MTNDGDKQTVVVGIDLCSSADALDAYDHLEWRRGNKKHGSVDLTRPIDLQTVTELMYRSTHEGWVIRCVPTKIAKAADHGRPSHSSEGGNGAEHG